MNHISGEAAAEREAARHHDGRFGEQPHPDPGQLDLTDEFPTYDQYQPDGTTDTDQFENYSAVHSGVSDIHPVVNPNYDEIDQSHLDGINERLRTEMERGGIPRRWADLIPAVNKITYSIEDSLDGLANRAHHYVAVLNSPQSSKAERQDAFGRLLGMRARAEYQIGRGNPFENPGEPIMLDQVPQQMEKVQHLLS